MNVTGVGRSPNFIGKFSIQRTKINSILLTKDTSRPRRLFVRRYLGGHVLLVIQRDDKIFTLSFLGLMLFLLSGDPKRQTIQ